MTMIDEKALEEAEAELSRVLSEVDYSMPTDGMARVLEAYEAAKPVAEPVADAAKAVLEHRVGCLPSKGWLKDTGASRAALERLAIALSAPASKDGG